MCLLAQSLVEYGAAGGILDAFAEAFSSVYQTLGTSMAVHPILWLVAACVAGFLLIRRS